MVPHILKYNNTVTCADTNVVKMQTNKNRTHESAKTCYLSAKDAAKIQILYANHRKDSKQQQWI